MGCWNHTCAITNLPIMRGEPVYVMLLRKQEAESLCYPTAYWSPLPFYFEGKYNDYGGVEECHGQALPGIIALLKQSLVEMEQGENQYHDIAVKREDFTVKTLFDADHENRLFLDTSGKRQQLKHIVIRKNVFEKLTANSSYYDYTTSKYIHHTCDEYVELVTTELLTRFKTSHDEVIESVKLELSKNGDLTDEVKTYMNSIEYKQWSSHDVVEEIFSRYLNGDTLLRSSRYINLKKLLVELYYNNSPQKIYTIMGQLVKQSLLASFMDSARKVWIPPCGAGSQDSSTSGQVRLANMIIEESAEIAKLFEE